MKRPPGINGAAFTDGEDGDQRHDLPARSAVSSWLGISRAWATLRQVHGTRIVRVTTAGEHGEADGLWTDIPDLPLAVFTADCLGVVLIASGAVGVAHAGWRGAAEGVVTALIAEMEGEGHKPTSAAIGPGIGPCCFEVESDVAARFPGDVAETTWGSRSVDLASAIRRELEGVELWLDGGCTRHNPGLLSHRENQTMLRMASIGWLR